MNKKAGTEKMTRTALRSPCQKIVEEEAKRKESTNPLEKAE